MSRVNEPLNRLAAENSGIFARSRFSICEKTGFSNAKEPMQNAANIPQSTMAFKAEIRFRLFPGTLRCTSS